MSYLSRLMAQTGIDLVPRSTHVDPVSPIAEIDVRQIASQAMPMPPEPNACARLPEPANAVSAVQLERVEHVAGPPTLTSVPIAPATTSASLLPATRATWSEASIPEIVVQQRPPAATVEPAVQDIRQPSLRHIGPEQPATTVVRAHKTDEPQAETTLLATRQGRPTFLEIRNWVASTPAVDEMPSEIGVARPEPQSTVAPFKQTAPSRAALPIPNVVPERVMPLAETHVELSIGTVQVVVEAPADSAQPARPQPPPTAFAPAAPPTWSRLSRRYIRF